MKKLQVTLLILCAFAGSLIHAQSSETIRQYIAQYKNIAIAEMQRTGVPAAITLAQGIHETAAGTSDLVLSSNNHFGIKCKGEWSGETVYHDDDAKGECFRKYPDPAQSYKDHSDFLRTRPNYASLFSIPPTDYEGWAYGLKKAGYATNPKYPQILIKLIQDYNLEDYTLIALNKKKDQSNAEWASASINTETSTGNSDVIETKSVNKDYPSSVFQINDIKVVFVPKGTSFLKVAQENSVDLARLFEFNEMQQQAVAATDQLVYLQRKKRTGSHEFHVVLNGETLYDIAQAEGVRKESLLEYNFLREGMQPEIGEKIYLTSKAPSMPKLVLAKSVYSRAVTSAAITQ
jgi:LysM repeat protein